jgi:hypothetical protein
VIRRGSSAQERLLILSTASLNGCTVWTGPTDKDGYGKITFLGKDWRAHRLAWASAHGPIPDGMVVRHKCDNPPCIGLDHLELGTYGDNATDRVRRDRFNKQSDRYNRVKMTYAKARKAREMYRAGALQRDLAALFGVGRDQISRIVNNINWKEPAVRSMTLSEAIELTGKDVYDYLDREADVPVVTTAGAQGDVSILRVTTSAATTPMPAAGVVVVQGESGHTHSLHGAGFFDRVTSADLRVGKLTVPDGVDVLMSHPEHGAILIAPGTYEIGRQREYRGEWALVAD